jgi:hypothetical protein
MIQKNTQQICTAEEEEDWGEKKTKGSSLPYSS